MADLEEGEIADSDSEATTSTDATKNQVYQFGQLSAPVVASHQDTRDFRFSKHRESPTSTGTYSFRSAPQNGNSSDDSVDTSDEDSPLWNCKRTKYLNRLKMEGVEASRRSQSPQFINPLLDKHRSSPVLQPPPRKKRNNIWGSVLQEQTLTQTMVGFGVDKDEDEDSDAQDRNVERYNYKKAREDTRPFPCAGDEDDMEGSDDDPFGGIVDLEPDDEKDKERKKRKRKHPVKDRLGVRSDLDKLGQKMYNDYRQKSKGSVKNRLGQNSGKHNKYKDIPTDGRRINPTNITEDDSVPDVVDAIVEALSEPKDDLITRVVKRLGQKKSIQLLRMTEDVEENGGMMVKNGSRRRSPGGVYLQLLKSDPDVTKADVDYIFEDNNKLYFEEMKRRKAERKARRKKEFQRREQLARQAAAENGGSSHDIHGNGDSMHMDHDATNGVRKTSERSDRSEEEEDSEGEVTPDTSGDQEDLDASTGGQEEVRKAVSFSSLGEEDMLTITVDEEDSIE